MQAKQQVVPNSLGYTAAVDTGVGCLAGFTLSWFILPMDQAVVQKMGGTMTLGQSLRQSFSSITKSPITYMRNPAFNFVAGTYVGTYLSKNYIDTFTKKTQMSAEGSAALKFWGVLAVNGGLSVFWKDPGLAKLFGSTPGKMPPASYAAWAMRDAVHMLGAVVVPDYLEQRFNLTKDQWRVAQLTCPMAVQLATTPFHLVGLDMYNEPTSTMKERLARVRTGWLPAAGIRMVRMFAPWSLGLLINRDLREWLLK